MYTYVYTWFAFRDFIYTYTYTHMCIYINIYPHIYGFILNQNHDCYKDDSVVKKILLFFWQRTQV